MLLEGDDCGPQVINFDLALSEASDDVAVVEHGRVVVVVLLVVLRARGVGVALVLSLYRELGRLFFLEAITKIVLAYKSSFLN